MTKAHPDFLEQYLIVVFNVLLSVLLRFFFLLFSRVGPATEEHKILKIWH